MKIVVCIKQVPDTSKLRFDSQDKLLADSVPTILNPACEYALENATRLKEAVSESSITVLTIGSSGAKEVLKRAIAMGADEALLLSDPAFAGGDYYATANILKAAIQQNIPDADVILLGQFSDDDMFGATGPALAQLLNIPSVTLSNKIEPGANGTLMVHRETEDAAETYEMTLPGLVCFGNSAFDIRIPNIKGVMRANRTEIKTIDLAGLNLIFESVGAAGSATQLVETRRKPQKSGGKKIEPADADAAADEIIIFLREHKAI